MTTKDHPIDRLALAGTSKKEARYVKIDKTDSADSRIGDGAYGVVYRARDVVTNQKVALKRIKLENEDGGIPATALREITLLKTLHHENVVCLKDIVNEAGRLYIVFELAHSDLKKLMDDYKGHLEPDLVRSYSMQMLKGLAYCHSRGVMHRDLKPQNLLVSKSGWLKLADFGLARTFSPTLRPLTIEVITRWYRAPEIMLGCNTYTTAVDVWSVACVIAEMSNREPYLPGDSEIDQLHKIFQLLGTPNETIMPGVTQLPYWRNNFPEWDTSNLSVRLPNLCADGVDLVRQLLRYNPLTRITASGALKHPYIAPSSLSTSASSRSSLLCTPPPHGAQEEQVRSISVDHQDRITATSIIPISIEDKNHRNNVHKEEDIQQVLRESKAFRDPWSEQIRDIKADEKASRQHEFDNFRAAKAKQQQQRKENQSKETEADSINPTPTLLLKCESYDEIINHDTNLGGSVVETNDLEIVKETAAVQNQEATKSAADIKSSFVATKRVRTSPGMAIEAQDSTRRTSKRNKK